jgi:hypothetical protein
MFKHAIRDGLEVSKWFEKYLINLPSSPNSNI